MTVAPSSGDQHQKNVITTITFDGTANHGQAGSDVTLLSPTSYLIIRTLVVMSAAGGLAFGAGAKLSLGVGAAYSFIGDTLASQLQTTATFWTATTGNSQAAAAIPASMKDVLIFAPVTVTVTIADITGGALLVFAYYDSIIEGGSLA